MESAVEIGTAYVERLKSARGLNPLTGQKNQPDGDDEFHEVLAKRGLYERYWDCTLNRCSKIPGLDRSQQKLIDKYIADLDGNIKRGIGMMLKGSVGTGKTSLAAAILQQHVKNGHSGLFLTMSSLLDNLFTMPQQQRSEYERRIREVSLLVLDDLGAEHHEGWVLTKVDAIIAERYNRMKATIITSNMGVKQLQNTYAERVLDRLKSTTVAINFDGNSMRKPVVMEG